MTRKELIDSLNKIDADFSVSDWNLDGIDIWPVIKVKLFFNYLRSYQVGHGNEIKAKPDNAVSIIKKLASSVLQNILFFFRKKVKIDVLFSETSSHYSLWNDKMVSRFSFPIKQYFGKHSIKIVNVNFGSTPLDTSLYDDSSEIIYVEKLAYFREIMQLLFDKILNKQNAAIANLKDIDTVGGFLAESGIIKNKKVLNKLLADSFLQIKPLIKTYNFILKKIQPRKIAEVCYYFNENLALNIISKRRGIPTIDMMHGGMGVEHVAYAGWEYSIPEDGYNVLPEQFAVWDATSHDLLSKWINVQHFHKSIVIGNPWLDYLIRDSVDFSFSKDKTIILYTMQYDFIESYIYEAIVKGGADLEWWIRLHPTKLYCLDEINKECVKRSISKRVNLEEANLLPLPIILNNCNIHISEFSGSILEASLLNKQSIILNPLGVDMYQYYIYKGACYVSTEKDPILLLEQIMYIIKNPVVNNTYFNNFEQYEKLFKN